MSPESAEMTKYVANALLSTKISFINEMANLCERMGGDINDVRRGIGHDSRIGFAFLFPGVGYGGSCFPKDVRALEAMAVQHGVEPAMLEAVDAVNERQKHVMAAKINEHFDGKLGGKTIAVWGLAFKPRTDDIREAPALVLIDWLLAQGAAVRVHDPEAMNNVRSAVRREAHLLRQPDGRPRRRRRAGDHDRVEGLPLAGLRRDVPADEVAGDLRRPESVRAGADAAPRVPVLQHRPAGGVRQHRVSSPYPSSRRGVTCGHPSSSAAATAEASGVPQFLDAPGAGGLA